MGKILKDNEGYYFETSRRTYRIYTLVNDDKVVIFADDEVQGGVTETFVSWLYMDGFEKNPEYYADDVESMVNDYEFKERKLNKMNASKSIKLNFTAEELRILNHAMEILEDTKTAIRECGGCGPWEERTEECRMILADIASGIIY